VIFQAQEGSREFTKNRLVLACKVPSEFVSISRVTLPLGTLKEFSLPPPVAAAVNVVELEFSSSALGQNVGRKRVVFNQVLKDAFLVVAERIKCFVV